MLYFGVCICHSILLQIKNVFASMEWLFLERSTLKVFEIPYGQIYPSTTGQQVLTLGSLYDSDGVFLTDWYFLKRCNFDKNC